MFQPIDIDAPIFFFNWGEMFWPGNFYLGECFLNPGGVTVGIPRFSRRGGSSQVFWSPFWEWCSVLVFFVHFFLSLNLWRSFKARKAIVLLFLWCLQCLQLCNSSLSHSLPQWGGKKFDIRFSAKCYLPMVVCFLWSYYLFLCESFW